MKVSASANLPARARRSTTQTQCSIPTGTPNSLCIER
uniref:Uncharacterized protein n=1 Tax=Rhizophora mucronata TaxID=61149 RepID=A0A2P2ND04_RHIMU